MAGSNEFKRQVKLHRPFKIVKKPNVLLMFDKNSKLISHKG